MQRRPGPGSPGDPNLAPTASLASAEPGTQLKVCCLLFRNIRRHRVHNLVGVMLAIITAASTGVLLLYVFAPMPARHSQTQSRAFLAPGSDASMSQEVLPPSFVQIEHESRVRGAVPGHVQRRYAAQRATGRFECFDGSGNFSDFEAVVNDEYCDCKDGSDEPGTSACSGLQESFWEGSSTLQPGLGGFACGWVLDEAEDRPGRRTTDVIRFGAVNDGICDCCGGEDEWDGTVLCPDTCSEAEAAEKAEASKSLAGSRAREKYVLLSEELKHDEKFAKIDGGPDGVFLAVAAEKCLELKDSDYRYEVCVFNHVTQHPLHGGRSFSLGKQGKWAESLWENGSHRKDYTKLIMDGGDHCFASKAPRKCEIHFECAETPAVLSVQEAQVCVYEIRVQTPAACHKLHHEDA